MKNLILITLISISNFVYSQLTESTNNNTQNGEISFGVRSTLSLFSESGSYLGIGAGWQVRYRLSKTLNTEWFADWIVTDIGGLGARYDAHIGESMILYPGKNIQLKNHFTPYILGGFCGDYTRIESNLYFDDVSKSYIRNNKERWSFATQLGIGTHYNFTERLDISFSSQYVLHFGHDFHSEIDKNSLNEEYLHIQQEEGGGLEGHLFFTISANFKIVDLIK